MKIAFCVTMLAALPIIAFDASASPNRSGLVPIQGESAPIQDFVIAGMQVGCGSAFVQWTEGLNDAARALAPRLIMLDSTIFPRLHPKEQLFVFAHECGHIQGFWNEAQADCWATKLGRNQGWFGPEDIQMLAQSFAGNPGDWTHAPGPARIQNIVQCFSTP